LEKECSRTWPGCCNGCGAEDNRYEVGEVKAVKEAMEVKEVEEVEEVKDGKGT
jgi:hypothetical protein